MDGVDILFHPRPAIKWPTYFGNDTIVIGLGVHRCDRFSVVGSMCSFNVQWLANMVVEEIGGVKCDTLLHLFPRQIIKENTIPWVWL